MNVFPLEELQRRINGLQSRMVEHGLDAALIVHRTDLYYYTGTGQDAHLFVPADGSPLLMVRRDFERASRESPLKSVRAVNSFSDVKNVIRSEAGFSGEKLGMQLDVLPVNNYRVYAQLFEGIEITDVSPLIKEGRMIKSELELDIMRQASRLSDEVFGRVRDILREGMTEVEFGGLLEAEYRKLGHQGLVRVRSFNQDVFCGHVMSGLRITVPSCSVGPTGGPGLNPSFPQGGGAHIIRRHEPILIDFPSVINGYTVDNSRTFFLGDPPEEFRTVHAVALKIQQAVAEQGVPGTRAEDLYIMAVSIAAEAGIQEGFMGYPQPVPFIAHGIGLELDEAPVLGRKSPHILQERMVIAVEPKFILPGKGYAGIENSFVVTSHGLEKLSHFDDEIQVLP